MTAAFIDRERDLAATAAVQLIEDGMIVGLGSGATAGLAIEKIGRRVANGLKITGIPTSDRSGELARKAGIPLTSLDEHPQIDLTIDGADRFDDRLNLIKGGGGALLREKIVAAASRQLVIITDSGKRSNPLGGFPVPVEVIVFGIRPLQRKLESLGLNPALRMNTQTSQPFVTDEGNQILDLKLATVDRPEELAATLSSLPGVVEHGLFIGLANVVLMGKGESVKEFTRG